MKKLLLPLILFMITGSFLSGTNYETAELSATESSIKKAEVEVYYFHRNRRCGPCRTIENLTKKTMETYYNQEMENGEVIFRIVNVQQDENREIAQKFNAVSTALFVNVKNGSDSKATNLTGFAYRYSRNEEAFLSELKKQIDSALGK
ncbi:MAG: nitrophenyl compound nitroreductase subunit ArsF family protein [Bacteroidales bacterium]